MADAERPLFQLVELDGARARALLRRRASATPLPDVLVAIPSVERAAQVHLEGRWLPFELDLAAERASVRDLTPPDAWSRHARALEQLGLVSPDPGAPTPPAPTPNFDEVPTSLFPALVGRLPAHARRFRLHPSGCVLEGATTLDDATTQAHLLAGGLAPGKALGVDGFVAGVRARQSEEIVVVFEASGRTLSFLERVASPFGDALGDARRALAEALLRWDRGESVAYRHRFLAPPR